MKDGEFFSWKESTSHVCVFSKKICKTILNTRCLQSTCPIICNMFFCVFPEKRPNQCLHSIASDSDHEKTYNIASLFWLKLNRTVNYVHTSRLWAVLENKASWRNDTTKLLWCSTKSLSNLNIYIILHQLKIIKTLYNM